MKDGKPKAQKTKGETGAGLNAVQATTGPDIKYSKDILNLPGGSWGSKVDATTAASSSRERERGKHNPAHALSSGERRERKGP